MEKRFVGGVNVMLEMNLVITLLGVGSVVGFLAGLLGIGGGLLTVPALVWFLESSGHQVHVQHLALGTSLAVMVFTNFSSVRAHHRRGAVDWAIVRRFAPSMVLGTLLGTQWAAYVPSEGLRWFFVAFAYAAALQIFIGGQPNAERQLPQRWGSWGVGGVIGVISSWVGIGGASMSVPFLTWCQVTIHRAIATSAALGWPIALSGAVGYVWSGWNVVDLPAYSLGFVYLPAMLVMCVVTPLIAPLGVSLGHRLPTRHLKKVFAVLLTVLASEMLWRLL